MNTRGGLFDSLVVTTWVIAGIPVFVLGRIIGWFAAALVDGFRIAFADWFKITDKRSETP